MDGLFNARRISMFKRVHEFIALVGISSTFFLLLHTRELRYKLRQMEDRVQSDDLSSSSFSGGTGISSVNLLMQQLAATGQVINDMESLNNTKKAEKELLVFNRVPKVGSQTLMELLRQLSHKNQFDFYRDKVQRVETIRLLPSEQLGLASMMDEYETPGVFIKHVCFINFTRFNLPEPIYMNVVRDPVERVISWYYYVRAPWYYVERKQAFPELPLPDVTWLKKDYETCVLSNDRECQYNEGATREGIGDHRRQSMFFCGHDDECTPFNTEGAVERAKTVVEKYYSVVGVLEDMNATLTVLENYIPRFFTGATDVYYGKMAKFRKINRNIYKPPVSEEIKEIVRRNFTREIDFYQFCRQRLHKQLLALQLPANKDKN